VPNCYENNSFQAYSLTLVVSVFVILKQDLNQFYKITKITEVAIIYKEIKILISKKK